MSVCGHRTERDLGHYGPDPFKEVGSGFRHRRCRLCGTLQAPMDLLIAQDDRQPIASTSNDNRFGVVTLGQRLRGFDTFEAQEGA